MKKWYKLFGMAMFGFSQMLFASSPYQSGNGWDGIMGLDLVFRTEPYQQVDNTIWLLPHLVMRHGNVFIEGLKIGYRTVENIHGNFNLILRPRLEGFDAQDSTFLNGMADRHYSLDGGIAIKWRQDSVEFDFSAVTDLLDNSQGKEMTVSLSNTFILTRQTTLLTPSVGLKWKSHELVNYYYGVEVSEARVNRPSYKSSATLNYTAAVNAAYSLTKRSSLYAAMEYERFGHEIYESPLVDKPQIFSVFMGYGWQF